MPMPITALPQSIRRNFEIREWRHATAILERDLPDEWKDVCDVLGAFKLCKTYLTTPGGRKSRVSEWIDSELYGKGWEEKEFDTSVLVDGNSIDSPTHPLGRLL